MTRQQKAKIKRLSLALQAARKRIAEANATVVVANRVLNAAWEKFALIEGDLVEAQHEVALEPDRKHE